MRFIELDLHKIAVVTRLPGVEMGWKWHQRQNSFQVEYIHLVFDVRLIRLGCPKRSRGAVFNRSD
jgi:hypothetical protein